MGKKDKKFIVDISLPDDPDVVNIDESVTDFIDHIIHIFADDITENTVFIRNKILYKLVYIEVEGEKQPIGLLVRKVDLKERDFKIEPNWENIFFDVNKIVPIVYEKGFLGFYILNNGSVAIDYAMTYGGEDEDINDFDGTDISLN